MCRCWSASHRGVGHGYRNDGDTDGGGISQPAGASRRPLAGISIAQRPRTPCKRQSCGMRQPRSAWPDVRTDDRSRLKNPDRVTLHVTARRIAIYLDNWAIIALAKDQTGLRARFLAVLEQGGDILFSETNASEIVGPTGASQHAVRDFFAAVGPRRIPVEGVGLVEVMKREARGQSVESCISHDVLQKFYAGRSIQLYGQQRLDCVPRDFFDLGFFLDWLVPKRDEIGRTFFRFDRVLREGYASYA